MWHSSLDIPLDQTWDSPLSFPDSPSFVFQGPVVLQVYLSHTNKYDSKYAYFEKSCNKFLEHFLQYHKLEVSSKHIFEQNIHSI